MRLISQKIATIVRSRTFFFLILVFFIFEAAWISVSARYPMAFDEGFHLGIIKIYAQQWSPILTHQPAGPAPYGALTTDPSYLYHYLMSFPYRLLATITSNQKTVIIALRFINIGFFTAALILFRRILLKTKASAALVHTALLFFVLVPIVPLLAGQINYDNLVILLLAVNVLLVLLFRDQLKRKKQCNTGFLLHILSFDMLASLVKFAYLPLFLAIALYLLYLLWKALGSPAKIWRSFTRNWHSLTLANRLIASVIFLISLGLFLQRYGVDVVKYHNIVPQCGQVLSVERCQAYGPWARNYAFAQEGRHVGFGNPVVFAGGWLYGMFQRSFFAINGPGLPASYDNKPPLPLLSGTAIAIFIFGLYLVGRYRRQIFASDPVLNFLLFVSLVYLAALIGRNYHDYVQLGGQLVAINGRYLLPIILPVLVAIAIAYKQFVQKHLYATVLFVVVLLFLQGGGPISFIYYSTTDWYWPHDQLSLRLNNGAKRIIKPFILGWPNVK